MSWVKPHQGLSLSPSIVRARLNLEVWFHPGHSTATRELTLDLLNAHSLIQQHIETTQQVNIKLALLAGFNPSSAMTHLTCKQLSNPLS